MAEGSGSDSGGNTIVIVARNNLHLTKLAVRSALAQDVPVDVLLIDNASRDGTARWALTKDIARSCFTDQRPLAACWNHALKWVWSMGRAHALVLNNDVEIRPDTYRQLLVHPYDGFVTCVSVSDHAQLRYPDQPASDSPHPDFSCFLIHEHVWVRVGPFDELFEPAYCEDCDYHVRMHRAGIRAVAIDLPFFHQVSSTAKNASPAERSAIERGAVRSRERFRCLYGCIPGTPQYEGLFS